jgi:hypothetical protein
MRGFRVANQLRQIGLWVCGVGLLASCGAGSAPIPATTASAGASAVSAETSASPALSPTGLRTFDEEGLVFEYPAAWREFHHPFFSTMSNSIADLATVDVPEPCATSAVSGGTQVDCADRFHLAPDSLVVHVMGGGNPAFDILRNRPAAATPLSVGGLPAYLEETAPVDPTVGADVSLRWTLSRPGSVDNFYTITALIRGPNTGPIEDQLRALIASSRYDPPVVPLPQASGAPEAALAKALGILAKDAPAWRCFPAHVGAARADISGFPSGPTFPVPHRATCTTAIEPTVLQLWRATFTIQLAEADPVADSRWVIQAWLQPDGTPGEVSAGPQAP